MTTVVDPAGTPIPIFNRGGVTIVEVATAGGSPPTTTPIPAASGHTIAIVDYTHAGGSRGRLELPSGDIGDVVEVFNVGPDNVDVVAASGDSLLSGPSVDVPNSQGRQFRKISAAQWAVLGQG